MILQCPFCQAQFKVSADPLGKTARCSKCTNKWKVAAEDILSSAPAPAEPFDLSLKPLDDESVPTAEAIAVSEPVQTSFNWSSQPISAADVFADAPTDARRIVPKRKMQRRRQYADEAKFSASESEKKKIETIFAAFGSGFKVPKAGLGYRFAATLAAFFMLLLPVLYVGVILLVIAAMFYHAYYSVEMFKYFRGRAVIFGFMLYIFPLLAGCVCVFFMFKPLFARPARQTRERSLTRHGEPILFALVDKICAVVKAPRPKQIDVDADVNASAGFRSGIWSLFKKGDLTLTIGAPLAAGFTVNQFVGVLAHEFGHFSQGGGMKMTFIVRSINHWFARVVYERDEWDQRLADQVESDDSDFRIKLLFLLSQLFVFIARCVLWCFMMIGHIACSILLREMEYNADLFEIRLCGTKNFRETSQRLTELSVGYQKAQYDLIDNYMRGQQLEDLPILAVSYADSLSFEEKEKVRDIVERETTGILDTHPSTKDRIAAANKEKADPVFNLDAPARVLFQHFNAVTKNVTSDFYQMLR